MVKIEMHAVNLFQRKKNNPRNEKHEVVKEDTCARLKA
jgi:hypothetical protein